MLLPDIPSIADPAFTTRLAFDPARLDAARLDVAIPLAGATTGNADYDGELLGASFFDVAKFPQARFTATRFRALGGNRYAADGTWDHVLQELLATADAAGKISWDVSVDATITRAHQHASNTTRPEQDTGGRSESQAAR